VISADVVAFGRVYSLLYQFGVPQGLALDVSGIGGVTRAV
jgi:hypothetical protein